MKTQNTKLVFGKYSITELNNDQLQSVKGGSTNIINAFNAFTTHRYTE